MVCSSVCIQQFNQIFRKKIKDQKYKMENILFDMIVKFFVAQFSVDSWYHLTHLQYLLPKFDNKCDYKRVTSFLTWQNIIFH